MRSLSLLVLAGLLASGCASTDPRGTARPPERQTQGVTARSITLDRAVYAVSWDGMIIVEAKKDGTMRVLTSK